MAKIFYGFLSGNLVVGVADASEQASAQKFSDLLKDELKYHFPEFDIEIVFESGSVGCTPRGLKTRIEYNDGTVEDDNYDVSSVHAIADRVFCGGAWIVEGN
jgi:hypothetical protein